MKSNLKIVAAIPVVVLLASCTATIQKSIDTVNGGLTTLNNTIQERVTKARAKSDGPTTTQASPATSAKAAPASKPAMAETVAEVKPKSQHIGLKACNKVDRDTDYNIPDRMLWEAVLQNETSRIQKAVSLGANIDHVLCNASTHNVDPDGFDILFANGLDPQRHCFIGHGMGVRGTRFSTVQLLERTRYLIKKGADVNCTYGLPDHETLPLLHWMVAMNGDKRFTEIDDNRKQVLLEILKTDAVKDINNYHRSGSVLGGITSLAYPKNQWLLDTLLVHGLNPNIQEKYNHKKENQSLPLGPYGSTLLYRAVTEARNTNGTGKLAAFDKYVEKGADPNYTYYTFYSPKRPGSMMDKLPKESAYTPEMLIALMQRGARYHIKADQNLNF